MTLMSALAGALTGLRATQAGLDIVSRNVANANTAGYTRKVLPLESHVVGSEGAGVRTGALQRMLDERVQVQLYGQVGVSQRYDVINQFLSRVDQLFGQPDEETSIGAAVTRLGTAFQDLADNAELAPIRQKVLDEAQALAGSLNSMSDSVQAMRKEAEDAIAASVATVNQALHRIDDLNRQIASRTVANQATADLEDQRDVQVRTLTEMIGVKFVKGQNNALAVFTASGRALVDGTVNELVYSPASTVAPYSSRDNGLVGRITLSGTNDDLLERNEIREGAIAGYVAVRDELLTQAQTQLDELAHALAVELSSTAHPVAANGAAATADFTNIGTAGDVVVIDYIDATATARQLVLKAGTDFAIGADDDATMANFAAAVGASAFGLTATPGAAGSLATVVTAPAGGRIVGVRSFTQVGPGLALFADATAGGERPYQALSAANYGATPSHDQKTGFAARITVSAALLADSTRLVQYQSRVAGSTDLASVETADIGSSTRGIEMFRRLTQTTVGFAAETGIGGAGSPYTGTIGQFATNVVAFQAVQADSYDDRNRHEQRLTEILEQKFKESAGVNVDDEMAQMVAIQNAYGASARVMTTVQAMLDELLSIVR